MSAHLCHFIGGPIGGTSRHMEPVPVYEVPVRDTEALSMAPWFRPSICFAGVYRAIYRLEVVPCRESMAELPVYVYQQCVNQLTDAETALLEAAKRVLVESKKKIDSADFDATLDRLSAVVLQVERGRR